MSKEQILARIRAALTDIPTEETPQDVTVPRDYARAHSQGELIPLLMERLVDYRARVRRVAPEDLPAAVADALRRREASRVAVPADLPPSWLATAEAERAVDGEVDLADLDTVDGAVTGCAVAIAETGTIVLDGGAAQGRRTITLVPDYHLCVVRADQVVASVPEAVGRLAPHRPLTWISGPSATSDIELDRVEGVHGPRTLEILIVG